MNPSAPLQRSFLHLFRQQITNFWRHLTWAEDPYFILTTTFKPKHKCGPAIMCGQGSLWSLGGAINMCWPKLASDLNCRHRRVRWIDRTRSLPTIMSKGNDSNNSARHCGSMSGHYSRMLMNKWHTTQITTNSARFNTGACTDIKFLVSVNVFFFISEYAVV
jgi:hypothetical protein